MYAHNISDCCISREKGMLKNFSRLRAGLFEKRPRRKTLVGCAANSGAGAALIQAAPPTMERALCLYRLHLPQGWVHGIGAARLCPVRREKGRCRILTK